jgi:hypothetical protein
VLCDGVSVRVRVAARATRATRATERQSDRASLENRTSRGLQTDQGVSLSSRGLTTHLVLGVRPSDERRRVSGGAGKGGGRGKRT